MEIREDQAHACLTDETLAPGAKLLWLVLTDECTSTGSATTRIRQPEMATRIGTTPQTIRTYLKQLTARGVLEIDPGRHGHTYRPVAYPSL